MTKKILLFTAALTMILGTPFAQEEEETIPDQTTFLNQFHPVEGLNQWQKSFDITTLEPGTYNIVVRGEDTAGNIYEAPAVDIRIDPESDRPTSSISYPSERMEVSGNLTVLGSARDDDGVAFVEVRLEDGSYTKARGSGFWSIDIPTDNLDDGPYTLTTRATDLGGVEGRETSLRFYLNNQAPRIDITSHRNGDLVSRKFSIQGTTSDMNGIRSLHYSLDEGLSWEEAGLKGKLTDGEGSFSLDIDSRELPDGPRVLRFRSEDLRGNRSDGALLVLVDNTPPVLEIVYPPEEVLENGRFMVLGRARDDLGIASLTWAYKGGEPQPIPMEPGNPYWSALVDFTGQDKMELHFRLEDTTGNVSTVVHKQALDLDADRPTVQLLHPSEEEPTEVKRLRGWILDDDAPAALIYRIDRGEELRFETPRAFDISLETVPPGNHTLTYRAVDINGLEGLPRTMAFSFLPGPPVITVDSVIGPAGESIPYSPGIRFRSDGYRIVEGTVRFESLSGTASSTLPGGVATELKLSKTDEPGLFRFSLELAEPVPFGYVPVKVKAEDGLGSQKEITAFLWIENLTKNLDPFGFYRSREERVILGEKEGYQVLFHGHPLETLELSEGGEFLTITNRNGKISLTPRAPGRQRGLVLTGITDRGTSFTLDLPEIIADFSAPRISLTQGPDGFIDGRAEVKGLVTDDLGPVTLSWALGNGEYQNVSARSTDEGWSFSLTVNAGDLPPQGALLKIQARDESGKTAYAYKTLIPRGAVEAPPKPALTPFIGIDNSAILPDALVRGEVYLGAALQGVEGITSLTYSVDGGTPQNLSGFPVAETPLGRLAPGAHTVALEAVYGEGKKLTGSLRFIVAEEMGPLTITGLTNGDGFGPEDSLTVEIAGGGKLQESLYLFDGGDPVTAKVTQEAGLSRFTIPLKGLRYGRHDLEITVTDIYGRTRNASAFFNILASKEGRSVDDREGLYPLTAEPGNHRFFFNGRPVEEAVLAPPVPPFSLDRKGSVITVKTEGPGETSGAVLAVTTMDGEIFRLESLNLTTDTTPPALNLETPETGFYPAGTLELSGTLTDDLAPASLAYSLGDSGYAPLEIPAEGIRFSHTLDLQGTPDGPMELSVRARDGSGNETVVTRLLVKDTIPPRTRQLLPEASEEVNGSTSVYFKVQDQWSESISGTFLLGESEEEISAQSGFVKLSPDFSPYPEMPETLSLTLKDSAGNEGETLPALRFNPQSDKPVISIQYPEENALFRKDPLFSGTIVDDDGVKGLSYSVDGGEPVEISGGSSFEIRLPFSALEDNEHTIQIIATDIYGVESDPVTVPFRISRAVPEAAMTSPELGTTNKKDILLSGNAFDANGIEAVFLSFDNGNSYQKVEGTEEWHYPLDSRILVDGTCMILIKARDNYGVESISSSLLTVDNTAPRLEISLPENGGEAGKTLPIQLRTEDGLRVKMIRYQITGLNKLEQEESDVLISGELATGGVVLDHLKVEELPPGLYNISFFVYDDADNETIVSRSFLKKPADGSSRISLLFPLSGASLTTAFSLTGRVEGDIVPPRVDIMINGKVFDSLQTNQEGYFTRTIRPGELPEGELTLGAVMSTEEGTNLESPAVPVTYRARGPWIHFTSPATGDYVSQRPWITGEAGYFDPETEISEEGLSRQEKQRREINRLEYSLNSGESFTEFKKAESWRFRLETQNIKDGPLNIMVRATFNTGETVLDQVFVVADATMPQISIVTPQEGLAFNQTLTVNGTAFDANGLRNLEVMLRPGSRNSYQVPQFIQGLYFDIHFLGATYLEGGIGLTFFDNNVKLQALAGFAPEGRFNGAVFGFKLLANVASLPYGYFFGPDWEFLSSSIAVGAAFEYFTMSESTSGQEGLVLGAVILQLELLKVEVKNLKMFNAYSLYAENQFWFISSDIQGGIAYRLAFGLRTNVF